MKNTTDRGEKFRKQMYGGLLKKNLKNMFIRELIERFGYSDKTAVAELMADTFIQLHETYAPVKETVKPGQMVWLAVDVDDPPARNKTLDKTKLKPVVVTVASEYDLMKLRNGTHPRKQLPQICARILQEAFDQGGVLSQYDVAVITGRSIAYVQKAISRWQKENQRSLPSRGTIHDLGSATTHKKQIVKLYLQGYRTSEIARKTQHDPVNVDRYVKDFKRVLWLKKDGRELNEIVFFTRLSETVVKEYLSIIDENNCLQNMNKNTKLNE
jgi:transposase